MVRILNFVRNKKTGNVRLLLRWRAILFVWCRNSSLHHSLFDCRMRSDVLHLRFLVVELRQCNFHWHRSLKWKVIRTLAMWVRCNLFCLSFSNASLSNVSSDNKTFLPDQFRCLFSAAAILEKPLMSLRLKLARPMKLHSCVIVFGTSADAISSTKWRLFSTLPWEITWPKKWIVDCNNSHFLNLTWRPFCF